MKKYGIIFFLFLAWGVAEVFTDPWRVIAVALAAAAVCCMLLVRKAYVGPLLAVGVCLGLAFYRIDFALYTAPVLFLLWGRSVALRAETAPRSGKKKKDAARFTEGVFTLTLFSLLFSVGTLIRDISFAVRNPARYTFAGFHTVPIFAVLGTALLLIDAVKHTAEAGKAYIAIYTAALICAVSAAAGFALNSVLYDVYPAVFPWLIFLAAGADTDPVIRGAVNTLIRRLNRRVSVEE